MGQSARRWTIGMGAVAVGLVAAAAAAQDAPAGAWRREGIRATHASGFALELSGYAQGDLHSPRDVYAGPDAVLDETTTEVRRLRVGLEAEWKRVSLQIQVDPTDEGEHLKDLYAELRVHTAFGLRAGRFKVPVTREFLTSASRLDLVERSRAVTALGAARDWGVMARGTPVPRLRYDLGVFAGDGAADPTRAGTTVAGRLVGAPSAWLELGGSFSCGEVEAGAGPDVALRGLEGQAVSGFTFHGPQLVGGRRRRVGADASAVRGPASLTAEWLRSTSALGTVGLSGRQRPDEVGNGWALSATWLVTGEKKARRITPARPLARGGIGAVELVARYESLRFEGGSLGSVSGDLFDGRTAVRAITAGLSWWPAAWLRVMGNVAFERFGHDVPLPQPGRRGEYATVVARIQLHTP